MFFTRTIRTIIGVRRFTMLQGDGAGEGAGAGPKLSAGWKPIEDPPPPLGAKILNFAKPFQYFWAILLKIAIYLLRSKYTLIDVSSQPVLFS